MSGVPYLLSIDHLLSDEERLVWSAAREFCERRVAPPDLCAPRLGSRR